MLTLQVDSHDPFYNQALEEYLFTHFTEDILYLWRNRPAVVVGSYQNICREVSVPTLRRLGIPVVRRMSGGGTVYHDAGNLNYTYILRQEMALDYDTCLQPMLTALQALGIPAQKRRSCDIAIGEQKISGSAQRSSGGRLLHHGTLLFDSDLSLLEQITTQNKNPHVQGKGTESAICAVTNLSEHLPKRMSIETFQTVLEEQLLPSTVQRICLTAEQEAEVQTLCREKYKSWAWTWGKTPPFAYEKEGTLLGCPIRVRYTAKKGIFEAMSLSCEAIDTAKAERLLQGARLEPEELYEICHTLAGENAEALLEYLL